MYQEMLTNVQALLSVDAFGPKWKLWETKTPVEPFPILLRWCLTVQVSWQSFFITGADIPVKSSILSGRPVFHCLIVST